MSAKEFHFRDGEAGVAFTIRVIPRARSNEISEVMDDGTLKIRLKAPPVDGKANEALVTFLADFFEVRKSQIEIVAGETGRNKLVSIVDLDPDLARQKIAASLG